MLNDMFRSNRSKTTVGQAKVVRLELRDYMKYILLLIFTWFSTPSLAQRFYRNEIPKLNQTITKLKQGKWVELAGDNLKSITHYKDDMLHGLVVEYWSNGHLKSEGEYRNDILHGYFRDYYRAGGRNRQGNYQRGLRNGDFTKYWENGHIRTRVSYENDVEHGLMLEYFKDGTLKRETPFVRGVIQGDVKTYNKQGDLVKSRTFLGNSIN